nr:hypothetical protein BaRGS_006750 [Batillaria attramentaria]
MSAELCRGGAVPSLFPSLPTWDNHKDDCCELPSALLLYTDDNGRYDYLQLALTKGAVRLWINFVAEENQYVDIEANTDALNDGRWHRVEIKRNRMETILLVDGTQTSKVALGSDSDFGRDPAQNNYVYFGGIPSRYESNLRGLALPSAFFSEKFRGVNDGSGCECSYKRECLKGDAE